MFSCACRAARLGQAWSLGRGLVVGGGVAVNSGWRLEISYGSDLPRSQRSHRCPLAKCNVHCRCKMVCERWSTRQSGGPGKAGGECRSSPSVPGLVGDRSTIYVCLEICPRGWMLVLPVARFLIGRHGFPISGNMARAYSALPSRAMQEMYSGSNEHLLFQADKSKCISSKPDVRPIQCSLQKNHLAHREHEQSNPQTRSLSLLPT